MKLIFPNGEHAQVLLAEGGNLVGSDPSCQVVLQRPGIAPRHCRVEVAGDAVTLRQESADATVSVNGNRIEAPTAVRPGDLLAFDSVQARLVAVERARSAPAPRGGNVDDTGATRLRLAVPKLMLRGVSGAVFGKTFPVGKELVIGRQQDCDIPVPAEEISRHHAKVKPTPDGLMVEDLGSANGTYINDKRVQQGLLKPGDELRLDTIRFLLIGPGSEIPRAAAQPIAQPATGKSALIAAAIVVGVLVVATVVVLLLR